MIDKYTCTVCDDEYPCIVEIHGHPDDLKEDHFRNRECLCDESTPDWKKESLEESEDE